MTIDRINDTTQQKSKEFKIIIPDLFKVFKQTNENILQQNVLPTNFYETNSQEILNSLNNRKDKDFTSIQKQFEENKYETSPYKLFHDIKVVSSILINQENVGSEQYKEIDFFYKFSTELLLREVGNIIESKSSTTINNDLENQLDEEFNQILTSYTLSNGEIITYISKTEEVDQQIQSNIYNPHHSPPQLKQKIQPLFSSIIGKSSLDTKPTLIKEPYSIAKVIPTIKDTNSNTLLETVSPQSQMIFTTLNEPPQILNGYFHPTWYTVAMPTWLTHKALQLKSKNSDFNNNLPQLSILNQPQQDQLNTNTSSKSPFVWGSGENYRSFVPYVDSTNTAVTDRLRGNIWLNHIGIGIIDQLKKKYINNQPHSTAPIQISEVKDVEMKDVDESIAEIKDTETKADEVTAKTNEVELNEIDLSSLQKWNPSEIKNLKYLKEHEKDIKSPTKLQKLISENLIKLNELRQDRYYKSDPRNPLTPNEEEKQIFNRAQRLIILAIKLHNVHPSDLNYKVNNNFPVLVSEYTGTLPGVPNNRVLNGSQISNNLPKSNRLQGLKTPSTRGGKKIRF